MRAYFTFYQYEIDEVDLACRIISVQCSFYVSFSLSLLLSFQIKQHTIYDPIPITCPLKYLKAIDHRLLKSGFDRNALRI